MVKKLPIKLLNAFLQWRKIGRPVFSDSNSCSSKYLQKEYPFEVVEALEVVTLFQTTGNFNIIANQ